NILLDMTKGIQNLHETMELCKEAFIEVMKRGPLADERVMGVKVKLMDAKLHEDTIHRGPAQAIPAMRQAIYGAMCLSGRTLLEPKQKVQINVPQEVMGAATREMQQRRSVIEDMEQEGDMVIIKAKAPVAQMFGFSNSMRGATGGRALWNTENCGFEMIPRELLKEVVASIRTRKGLKPEPYDANYYSG
ncbi:MAG: elongation factor EF-2, partial [Thermoplasmata archaeon]|nr:elongation factor EF-2 [Thermoplasmata archaeon]